MAVFSPSNAKVHFKAYDGSFSDYLGNTTITQNNSVTMSSAQKLFGQQSMYMANPNDSITFDTASVFDVGTGNYTVGFWYRPTALGNWARIFATDTYQHNKPLRIYSHNGTISVYAESTTDGTSTHDLVMSHYLGANSVDNWWHIMIRRDSGTTKLYINGSEEDSSTMSYDIDNSNNPTLGADSTVASGVKGYIQDFFWTEDAISFTQADFDPDTAEPITFRSGNPSISSFSTSAASVASSGDSVTLSWTSGVVGETKLELLKYVGGILSNTDDVLGLSSKSVTITETVSYKLRATNDNGSVDSSLVEITLNGGSNMAIGNNEQNLGLVVQKDSVRAKGDLAGALKVNGGGILDDVTLNAALVAALSQDASIVTAYTAADASLTTADASVRTALTSAFTDADTVVTNAYTAKDASVALSGAQADAGLSSDIEAMAVFVQQADASLTTADASVRTALTTSYVAADAIVTTAFTTADTAVTNAFQAADTALTTAFGLADAVVALSGAQADATLNASQAIVWAAGDASVALSGAQADASVRTALTTSFEAADTNLSNVINVISLDVDANELDGDDDRALIRTEFAAADTGITNAYIAADAGVTAAFTAADITVALSGAQADATLNASQAVVWTAADAVVTTAYTAKDASVALSGAQADASLAAVDSSLETLINGAVQWSDGNRTLQIGDHVEFVFENYAGFSAGDPVSLEIKYKS